MINKIQQNIQRVEMRGVHLITVLEWFLRARQNVHLEKDIYCFLTE